MSDVEVLLWLADLFVAVIENPGYSTCLHVLCCTYTGGSIQGPWCLGWSGKLESNTTLGV